MEFIDLAAQQKQILPGIEKRIARVLAHGKYVMGPEVFELEAQLTAYTGVRHVVSCASGTDALLMVLMALNIGPGDAVFTPPFTFVATAEVICLLGATPVFVDVDPDTWTMDPKTLEAAVREVAGGLGRLSSLVPRCVIPVDIFGLPADYDAIHAVAGRYNLFVLEDAAQSFGAVYKGGKAGSLGHAAATSFFRPSPWDATETAGPYSPMTTAWQRNWCRSGFTARAIISTTMCVSASTAGWTPSRQRFSWKNCGYSTVSLRARSNVAGLYRLLLENRVVYQAMPPGFTSAWAQFSIRHPDRDRIMADLKANQVPTAVYYPIPLHCQPAFAGLGYAPDDFPVSLGLSRNIFSLPMHPYLKEADIRRICDLIH